MGEGPSFEIPVRPERYFPFSGGVEYEGSTVFVCRPPADEDETDLADHLETVLDEGPYRYGDFIDLPMPVYLVKDEETGDVFRVAVREESVRLHVLPETESEGLAALYQRLTAELSGEWSVERRTNDATDS